MKRNKLSAIWMTCLLLVSSMAFTACSEDDLDTNQYKSGIGLNAYGPIPVMRGGTLRFLGSNLDQVSQVVIPGVSPITNIDVVASGDHSEIRVTVPHDGPEEGLLELVTNDGKEIWTKTPLSYIEGIEITSFTPAAMPGETVKIEGDYLNLIHMVEFSKGVQVSENEFLSHDRYNIEVVVPDDAQTGKLALYTADLVALGSAVDDVSYQIVETETVLEVGTPTTSKIASPRGETANGGTVTAKQGETITLTGTFYNLVKSVKIGNVEITDLNKNGSNSISFVVPAEAANDAINLVCTSSVEVPVATLQTIVPTELAATPMPVKAGDGLTISGKDMDLVVAVEFPSAGKQDGDKISIEADKVMVKSVPDNATDGSAIKLHMANGKSVEVAYQLLLPTVTAYDQNPASAGGKIQISGTDLDLVKSINFGTGKVTLTAQEVTATAITTTVPMDAQTGKPEFVLANGAKVEGPELNINEAVFCYITELPTEDTKPDAGSVVTVPVKNGDKLEKVTVDGTEVKFVYDDKNSMLTFGIPQSTGSTGRVKLISSNGEIEYQMPVKPATEVEMVVFTGPLQVTWGDGGRIYISPDQLENVPDGAKMVFKLQFLSDGAQIQINDGGWSNADVKFAELGNGAYIKPSFVGGVDVTECELVMTAEILNLFRTNAKWGNAIIMQGSNAIVNKISFKWENVLEKDLANFVQNMNGTPITYPYTLTWGDDGRFKLTQDLLLNELKVKKGSVLRVYKNLENTGQVQINNSSWTAIDYLKDWNKEYELMEKEFDDAMMEAVNNGGLVIQGGLSGITKIAILP